MEYIVLGFLMAGALAASLFRLYVETGSLFWRVLGFAVVCAVVVWLVMLIGLSSHWF